MYDLQLSQGRPVPLPSEGPDEGAGGAYGRRIQGCDSLLRPHPHPALRATFSRREKGMLAGFRRFSGKVKSKAPLPLGEGLGRGCGRSLRTQDPGLPTPRSARTLIRRFAPPSPEGRRACWPGFGAPQARASQKPLSHWERGWGEGAGGACGRRIQGCDSTLRPNPHPALCAAFSRGEKGDVCRRLILISFGVSAWAGWSPCVVCHPPGTTGRTGERSTACRIPV